MNKPTSRAPRRLGDVVEDWLATLDGPAGLAAFRALPVSMQRGAWEGLRLEVELEREGKRAA